MHYEDYSYCSWFFYYYFSYAYSIGYHGFFNDDYYNEGKAVLQVFPNDLQANTMNHIITEFHGK